jgi:hypothetical protein
MKNPNGTAFAHVTDAKLESEIQEAQHAIKTIGRRMADAVLGRALPYDANQVSSLARWRTHLAALMREREWRAARAWPTNPDHNQPNAAQPQGA